MGLLDSITQPINDLTHGGMLGIDKENIGLLGMALMGGNGGGNNFLQSMMMMQMLGGNDPFNPVSGNNSQSNGMPNYNQTTNPSSVSSIQSLPTDKQALLQQLKSNAESAFPDNPTMQQVAITQAIHESGLMGKPSLLATKDNNLFGIKSPGSSGVVNMPTWEVMNGRNVNVNADFGRNASTADSFMQYKNLMNRGRYAPVLQAQNPYEAFNALQRSGYATDPRYANKLNNVYSQYVAPLY
jgi:flagellum-specific peptidoglycan hydrolase FlgJ